MIIYHREKQTIVIPAAFGDEVNIAPQGCEEAIEEAYQAGWTNGYTSGVSTEYGEAIQNAFNSGASWVYPVAYGEGYNKGKEECMWDKMVQIGFGDVGINNPLAAIYLRKQEVDESVVDTDYFDVQTNSYQYDNDRYLTYSLAVGIKPKVYERIVLKQGIIPAQNITIYGENSDDWNLSCDNVVFSADTSIDELWQFIVSDYREFPFGLSYLKPTDINPAYRRFRLDGVYDAWDTIPAGTHSIELFVNTNQNGMIVNLSNFRGDIIIG